MFETKGARAALVAENDNFAAAIVISSDQSFLHARFAGTTIEPGEPDVFSGGAIPTTGTVWWKYAVPRSGYLVYQSEFFTQRILYSVYRGTKLSNLVRVGPGLGDRGGVRVESGETYYFQLQGSPYPSPLSGVRVQFSDSPVNDSFETATPLEVLPNGMLGFNGGATQQTGEPSFQDPTARMTVWYSWAATYEGTVSFGVIGESVRMNVFRGTSLDNLVKLPAGSGAPTYAVLSKEIAMQAGETYYLQIDSIPRAGTAFRLEVISTPAKAANDDFAKAEWLSGDRPSGWGAFKYASTETSEPLHRPEPHKSVWWKWYAPRSGTLGLSSSGGGNPAPAVTFAIYEGRSLAELRLQAKGNGSTSAQVRAGHLYFIAFAVPSDDQGMHSFQGSLVSSLSANDADNLVAWTTEAWSLVDGLGVVVDDRLELPAIPVTASQRIAVEPGQLYAIGLSYKSADYARFRVNWAGNELATVEGPSVLPNQWRWTNFLFRATASEGTLSFENLEGPVSLSTITVKAAAEPLRESQVIEFEPSTGMDFAGSPLLLEAKASSGLPVTFRVISGRATIANGALTPLEAGEIVIRASQPGDDRFAPAPDVDRTIAVNRAQQVIHFAEIPAVRFGNGPLRLAATSSAGLDITYQLVAGPAELNGDVLTILGPGIIQVRALAGENQNYLPAVVLREIPVAKALQSITFLPPARLLVNSSIDLGASASSGLPVLFELISGPGDLTEGVVLQALGEGELLINALQPGNGNFEAAPVVQRSIRVTAVSRLEIVMTKDGSTLKWEGKGAIIETAETIQGPWEIFDTTQAEGGVQVIGTSENIRFFRSRAE